MNAKQAYERGYLSDVRKKRIEATAVCSCFLTIVVVMFLSLFFGVSAVTHKRITQVHNRFHSVTGVISRKGPLLGGEKTGDGEFLDHYRVRVQFTDSTGRVRNPEAVVSWRLKSKSTVRVYDGPGGTYDIPAAIEGSHPRSPSVAWMWLLGIVLSFIVGVFLGYKLGIAAEKMLTERHLPRSSADGPVPAI